MNRLMRYAAGSVRFAVLGGRGERFLNLCVGAGIPVEHIRSTETGYEATVPLRDYRRMHKYARRERCRLRVREKYGAYFALRAYRGRWGILAGLALGALVLLAGKNLIWNICFLDFAPEQEAYARARLFEEGIYEGAFQDTARLMRAAAGLFVDSEEYGWVTLNFVKGRLVVEKTRREKPPAFVDEALTDVVASSDGIVRRVDLQSGYPQVTPGQYVAKGQVLVSAMTLNSYEHPQYSRADAAVYAEVERTYVYAQPLQGESTLPAAESRSYYALFLPWGRLPLYARAETPPGAACRVLRRPAAPLGFHLPALVEELQVRPLEQTRWRMTPAQAQAVARSRILDVIRTEFEAYELLEETPQAREEDGVLTLTLHVRFLADIGKLAPYTAPPQAADGAAGANS